MRNLLSNVIGWIAVITFVVLDTLSVWISGEWKTEDAKA